MSDLFRVLKELLSNHAAAIMAEPLSTSINHPLFLSLHRWKGFEKANAFAYRGRKQHDLLAQGIKGIFTAKQLTDAEAKQLLAQNEELPEATKTAIKISKVIKGFEADEQGMEHDIACMNQTK